jgi:hypothetical protein
LRSVSTWYRWFSGEYRPRFWDWQTLVVGDLPRYTQVSLYAAVLHSRFSLQPTNLLLRYNCSGRGCDEFSGQGEGEERFTYQTRVLGLQWKHQQARKELLAFAHLQH